MMADRERGVKRRRKRKEQSATVASRLASEPWTMPCVSFLSRSLSCLFIHSPPYHQILCRVERVRRRSKRGRRFSARNLTQKQTRSRARCSCLSGWYIYIYTHTRTYNAYIHMTHPRLHDMRLPPFREIALWDGISMRPRDFDKPKGSSFYRSESPFFSAWILKLLFFSFSVTQPIFGFLREINLQ